MWTVAWDFGRCGGRKVVLNVEMVGRPPGGNRHLVVIRRDQLIYALVRMLRSKTPIRKPRAHTVALDFLLK